MNGPELPLNYIITFITGIKKSLMCVDVTTIIYYQQAIYSVYYFFFQFIFLQRSRLEIAWLSVNILALRTRNCKAKRSRISNQINNTSNTRVKCFNFFLLKI